MKITRWTVTGSLGALLIPAALYLKGMTVPAAACGVLAVIFCCLLLFGRHQMNFFDRQKVKRNFRTPRREAVDLLSYTDDSTAVSAGFTIDGSRFSMYIELNSTPYAVMKSDDELDTLPLDVLTKYLLDNVDGLQPDTLNVISHCSRVADAGPYSGVYSSSVPNQAYPGSQTVVEVTMTLEHNLRDVYMRTGTSDPSSITGIGNGIARSLFVCTYRLVNTLRRNGIHSHILTEKEVRAFNDLALTQLNSAFVGETWDGMVGDDDGPNARVVYIPKDSEVIPELDIYSRSTLSSRRLVSRGKFVERDGICIVTDDVDVPEVEGGEIAAGVQGDLAMRVVPLANHVDCPVDPVVYSRDSEVTCTYPSQSLGVYAGVAAVADEDGDVVRSDIQVFLDLAGTKGDILYVDADRRTRWSLLARLATIGEHVTVLSKASEDSSTATRLSIPTLKTDTTTKGSSVAALPESMKKYLKPTNLRLTIMMSAAPRGASHILSVKDGIATLVNGAERTSFFWDYLDGEIPLLRQAGL